MSHSHSSGADDFLSLVPCTPRRRQLGPIVVAHLSQGAYIRLLAGRIEATRSPARCIGGKHHQQRSTPCCRVACGYQSRRSSLHNPRRCLASAL